MIIGGRQCGIGCFWPFKNEDPSGKKKAGDGIEIGIDFRVSHGLYPYKPSTFRSVKTLTEVR